MGLVGLCVVEADGKAGKLSRVIVDELHLGLFNCARQTSDGPVPWPVARCPLRSSLLSNALAWSPTLHDETWTIIDRLGRQCAASLMRRTCRRILQPD